MRTHQREPRRAIGYVPRLFRGFSVDFFSRRGNCCATRFTSSKPPLRCNNKTKRKPYTYYDIINEGVTVNSRASAGKLVNPVPGQSLSGARDMCGIITHILSCIYLSSLFVVVVVVTATVYRGTLRPKFLRPHNT